MNLVTRLEERDPVGLRLLPGLVAVERLHRRELQDLRHRVFRRRPFEDQRSAWLEHAESLRESGTDHFPPVAIQPPIFHGEESDFSGPLEVRRVEDHMEERVVREGQVGEVVERVRVSLGPFDGATLRPVHGVPFAAAVVEDGPGVLLVEPHHSGSAAHVEHLRRRVRTRGW
jgi:hypothetical protein